MTNQARWTTERRLAQSKRMLGNKNGTSCTKSWTVERRLTQAERMRKQWQDSEWVKKRIQRSRYPASCLTCRREFSDTSTLLHHLHTNHGNSLPPVRPRSRYPCSCVRCHKQFADPCNFHRHLQFATECTDVR